MEAILLSSSEVARRAQELYDKKIRAEVEREENIGKMVIIDIETGEYGVDKTGLSSAKKMRQEKPYARLFGIKIGYNVAAAFGGGRMERTYK